MRIYKNQPEQRFTQLAISLGWKFTKRGWPDFLCMNTNNELVCVEVKPVTSTGRLEYLKTEQVFTMNLLTALGVKCYVSDGLRLETYDCKKHASLQAKKRLKLKG